MKCGATLELWLVALHIPEAVASRIVWRAQASATPCLLQPVRFHDWTCNHVRWFTSLQLWSWCFGARTVALLFEYFIKHQKMCKNNTYHLFESSGSCAAWRCSGWQSNTPWSKWPLKSFYRIGFSNSCGQDGLVTSEDSQEIRDVFPSVGTAPRTRNHQIAFLQNDGICCLHTPNPLPSCSVGSRFKKQFLLYHAVPMPIPLLIYANIIYIRLYQAFHNDTNKSWNIAWCCTNLVQDSSCVLH